LEICAGIPVGALTLLLCKRLVFLLAKDSVQGNSPTKQAGRLLILAAILFLLPMRSAGESARISGSFPEDGRSFRLSGFAFEATWSATIQRDGEPPRVLSSADGSLVPGPLKTLRFPDENIDLLFEMESRSDAPAVMLRAGIRNHGKSPVKLLSATPIAAEWKSPADHGAWVLTGFHPRTPVLRRLSDLHEPADIHEYGGCYHPAGKGFLFGPIGEPVAYLKGRFERQEGGRIHFECTADMSGARVDPGDTRWGQQVVLLMEPPRQALPRWADWIGKSHHARVGQPPLTGWGSWYSFGHNVTGKDVLRQVEVVRANPHRLRPDVILIDRGHEVPGRFPEGLPFYAKAIAATGARPGLRLEFEGISDPGSMIRKSVGEGFAYLKLSDMQPVRGSRNAKLTGFEIMRGLYADVRRAAGPSTYLLNSPLHLDRASVGFVDASRTGTTATRKNVLPVMEEVLRSYHLNGRWFAIDNDHFYLGTDIANVSEIVGGWPVVRTWMSMAGLSCGAAFTSDPLNLESVKPFWRNLEVMTPPAREKTEVLDLGTGAQWPRLVGQVRREWGDATVALLWNPLEKESAIKLDFKNVGMQPEQRYAVWSFWDNRYLGLAQEFWNTPSLAPSASQHLRFTPIPDSTVPQLIGSNLHILCGAAEIKTIRSSRTSMAIDLTDAGARAGDLFVYSRFLPILKSASGLVVTAIDQAGENVWRIRMRDREPGAAQRIALSIQLPVTRQWWFWTMIAVMVASIGAAVWRYVALLRLERKHALAVERTRIARDLHDDLGANLAEIAMISDLAQERLPEDDPSRDSLNEIFSRAETNARRLGEIVWAINPANDTLERFAGFLCKFTQDYLALARVGCRLDVPGELPPLPLNSIQRHNLFLAAKEAVHNAVRHGKPAEITLRLDLRGDQVTLVVEDNGCGFDPSEQAAAIRGTRNMRERMEKIGGTFTCRSAPGQGTTITLTAPLKP
jgi:signal transduction histidine kinase